MWEWGGPATFAHDELTTDKRNPTANANGMIYGFDWVNDGFLIVEPAEHTATELRIPVLDPKTPTGKPQSMPVPSPYWGDTLYWTGSAATNHAAMDSKGRVWMSSRFRVPEDQPPLLRESSFGGVGTPATKLSTDPVLRPQRAHGSVRSTPVSIRTTSSSRRTKTRRSMRTVLSAEPSDG